jgi:hypothetical protein
MTVGNSERFLHGQVPVRVKFVRKGGQAAGTSSNGGRQPLASPATDRPGGKNRPEQRRRWLCCVQSAPSFLMCLLHRTSAVHIPFALVALLLSLVLSLSLVHNRCIDLARGFCIPATIIMIIVIASRQRQQQQLPPTLQAAPPPPPRVPAAPAAPALGRRQQPQ